MKEHRFTLPLREFEKWRPTIPTIGSIPGVAEREMTCVATNGILGIFVQDGFAPLYGHVQHFRWLVPVITMVPYIKDGQQRFFKQVKDHGAPSILHGKPKTSTRSGEKAVRTKKAKTSPPKMSVELALEVLKKALKP